MNDESKNKSRRDVLRGALTIVPAGVALWASTKVFGAGAAKPVAPAAGALKLVPESDPTAKALKYTHDAATAKRDKRQGIEGKDQTCANCQLYTKQGTVDGKEAGKCLMINGGAVTANGWCASWTKKA